jgi:hypothetical protein
LQWLRAFFLRAEKWLTRSFYTAELGSIERTVNIAMDASPWGYGAVLFDANWKPLEFWHDKVQPEDCAKLQVRAGESEFMTVLEALVALISIRIWFRESLGATLAIRSDNQGVGAILEKLRSPNAALNLIAAEVALDLALARYTPVTICHIPGLSNFFPDALSRLLQPGKPKQMPVELQSATRISAPKRDASFWLVKNLNV